MAIINQNDITFNNVKQPIDFGMGPVGIAGQTGVDPEFGGVINAVDIDWNAAELPLSSTKKTTINTTGDLLATIGNISSETKNTSSSIAALNTTLNTTINPTLSDTKNLTYSMLKNNKFGISVDHFDIAYNSYGGGCTEVIAYIPKSDLIIGPADIRIDWKQNADFNVDYGRIAPGVNFMIKETETLNDGGDMYYICSCYIKDILLNGSSSSDNIYTTSLKITPYIKSDYYYQTSYKSQLVITPFNQPSGTRKFERQCYYVGDIDPSIIGTDKYFINIDNSDGIYTFNIDEALMETQNAYTTAYYDFAYYAILRGEQKQSPTHIIIPSSWNDKFKVVDNDGMEVTHTSFITGKGPKVSFDGQGITSTTDMYYWKVYENIGKEYHITQA